MVYYRIGRLVRLPREATERMRKERTRMKDEKRIPRLLDEREVLLAEHEIISSALEWGFEDEKTMNEAMNYIFGAYDLTVKLLRECRGE